MPTAQVEEPTRCQAQRKDGSACAVRVRDGETCCWAHSPQTEQQRDAARRAGGRASSNAARASKHLPKHLQEAERRLVRLLDDLECGQIAPRTAEVIGGLI